MEIISTLLVGETFYQHGIARNGQRFTVAIVAKLVKHDTINESLTSQLMAYIAICNPKDRFSRKNGRTEIDKRIANSQSVRIFKIPQSLTATEIRTEMSIHLQYMATKVANNLKSFKQLCHEYHN